MTARRIVLLIIALTLLARMVVASLAGYGVDEAYMVGNARIFSLSYVDHPPLHVWLAGAMMRLFGSEAAFLVRLPFILLFAGSTWLLYRLSERLFGERAGVWAVIAFNLAPVFTLVHSSFVLPDGPLIFFLLASANVLAGIFFGKTPRPLGAWLAAGALAGLALLSKYTAALPIAGALLFMASVPSARQWLRTPGPWLAGLLALVIFSPVIYWNLTSGLASFAFQSSRLAGPSSRALEFLGESLGGQMAYLTPWLFIPLAISLVRALAKGRAQKETWFLALLALGPIALFTALTIGARGLPHWQMPGWLFVFPLLGRDLAKIAEARPRLLRNLASLAAALVMLIIAAAAIQTAGWGIPQAAFREWHVPDPTGDLVDWTSLPEALAKRGLLNADLVVAAPNWIVAGKASQALGAKIPVFCLCREPHHFPFRTDYRGLEGRDVILIAPAIAKADWWPELGAAFESVTPLAPISIDRAGESLFALELARAKNLRFQPR